MAPDPSIVNTAYGVAKQRGANDKVILALFQAGLVESGFRNLTGGPDDSVGYLQQRPSQGWPSPNNVATATNSFLDRAIQVAAAHPEYSPGQIAQAVQRSAFPARYDEFSGQATQLLATISPAAAAAAAAAGALPGAAGGVLGGVGADVLSAIATGVQSAAAGVSQLGRAADANLKTVEQITKLFLPSNMVRLAAGVAGFGFLIGAIWLLGRELRSDNG